MKLTCQSCHTALNLPDDKVPIGRAFNFTCPRCKVKNTTIIESLESSETKEEPIPNNEPAQTEEQEPETPPFSNESSAEKDEPLPPPHPGLAPSSPAAASTTAPPPNPWQPDDNPPPTAFSSPLPMSPGGGGLASLSDVDALAMARVALLAVNEGPVQDSILDQLENLEYMVTISYGMRDALRQLKLSNFDLVIIADDFDGAEGENNPLMKALQVMEMETRRRMFLLVLGPNFRTLDGFTAYGLSVNAVINTGEVEQFEKILISGMAHHKRFYKTFSDLVDKRSII